MCGVIGFYGINDQENIDLLRECFYETSIRGIHATGISYFEKEKIQTIIEKSPARECQFLDDLEEVFKSNEKYIKAIGHCRYSTSDIEWNQPIYNENESIVHNGVMTQLPHKYWEETFGFKTDTKNDTELLLRTQELEVFEKWPDSSISACKLTKDKGLLFFRNGKRPLYFYSDEKKVIILSTKDIFKRVGLDLNKVIKVHAGNMNKIIGDMDLRESRVFGEINDLQ